MAERIYITEDDDSIRELVTVAVRYNAAGYGRRAGGEDSS